MLGSLGYSSIRDGAFGAVGLAGAGRGLELGRHVLHEDQAVAAVVGGVDVGCERVAAPVPGAEVFVDHDAHQALAAVNVIGLMDEREVLDRAQPADVARARHPG